MYIFKLKTKEGYTFKVLAELLQNSLKEECFIINSEGITLSGIDKKTNHGTELINLKLNKDRFVYFKCNKEVCHIGINLLHFYRMLKAIKKKDTLVLYIEDEKPLDLGIKIQQNGDNSSSTSYIKVSAVSPLEVEIPTDYQSSIITTSKEFQKLKMLNKISKYVKITSNGKRIKFFCNKENILSRDVAIGEEDEDSKDEDGVIFNEYNQTFETNQIIKMVKMACLSSVVQIFIKKDLPLKFSLSVGSLGNISIYIKSRENIELEEQVDGESLENIQN